MPRNQFQRMIFAFITVVITVHAYVFYSLYVVNGDVLMTVNNAHGVLEAISKQGGIYMFGKYLPFTQLFFIQPLVRTIFKTIFARDIAAREQEAVVE